MEGHNPGDDDTLMYRKAADAVRKATFLLVGAGAGMSADSGLPGMPWSALLLP